MSRILAAKLTPGMKLARPVLNESGFVMIGEDAELTEMLIEKIQGMGVDSVYVHGASKVRPPKEEVLAALDERFRNVEAMPNMGLLKKVIADHIEGLYEEHGSSESLKDRIENVRTLATIPTVANRLMELVADPAVSVTEISRFISSDPVLTTKYPENGQFPRIRFSRKDLFG